MEIEALRWFQQVADGMTVTELSDLESVSQSGVSRGLARLEREIGVPLLRRTGRTLRMTQPGAVFKRYVDAVLHVLDDGLAAVHTLAAPETGNVAVAYQPSLGVWLVPELIARFRRRFPDVGFELYPMRDEMSAARLAGGRADVEITAVRPGDPAVRWRPLASQPLRLSVASTHRLADAGRTGLGNVRDEPFVMLPRNFALRAQTEQLCERAGFAPRVTFEADDLHIVSGFVAAGLGLAVVPAPRPTPATAAAHQVAPWSSNSIRYLEIEDDTAVRQIGVGWSAERRLLPAAANFLDHVLQQLPRIVG